LLTQFRSGLRGGKNARERAISHHALETGNTRLKRFQFRDEVTGTALEFLAVDLIGARRRPLNDVGEANAMRQKGGVVFRFEAVDPEGAAGRFAQDGARECRPEPVNFACEIVPLGDGVQPTD